MDFIAHRGFAKNHLENTLGAFGAAVEMRRRFPVVSGIELDIQLSGDGELVVVHDPDLTRLAGIPGRISELAYSAFRHALQEHRAGCTEVIPRLREVFELVNHALTLHIELKDTSSRSEEFTGKLASELAAYSPQNDVCIISFSIPLLENAEKCCGHKGLSYGWDFSSRGALEHADRSWLAGLEYLNPSRRLFAREDFTLPLARGQKLNVWTVNRSSDLAILRRSPLYRRIASVITDDLDWAVALPGRKKKG